MPSSPWVDPIVVGQLQDLGGEALVKRLVNLFLESSRGYVNDIFEGLGTVDLERVEIAAHTLKSGAGSLGARRVYDLAEELELAARGSEIERVRQIVSELSGAYEKTCEDLAGVIGA